MADRIAVPLPDGRWLALDRDTFDAALAAGVSLGHPAPSISTSTVDVLLTPEQIAERLGLPQSWIEEATRQGRIPCHEFGRYRRYSLPEVIDAAKRERRNGDVREQ
jgi:excisionase family DNA binding protein